MKKYLAFFIIALSANLQAQELDSILHLLKNHKATDTTRAFYYGRIAKLYSYTKPDSGLLYADSSIVLSVKLNAVFRLAHAYGVKALNLSAMGNDSAAIRFYQLSLLYARLSGDEILAAMQLQNMGISYYNQSMLTNAEYAYHQAYELFKKHNHQKGISASVNSLGVVSMDKTNYPKALEYYFHSLKISETQNDLSSVAQSYSNIGLVFEKLKDYKKALNYQQKAIDIYTRQNNASGLARSYNNIANVYDSENNPLLAIDFYRKALAINLTQDNKYRIASNYANIGIVYKGMQQFDSAYGYLNKALTLFENINDISNNALTLDELSSVLQQAPASFLMHQNISLAQKNNKVLDYKKRALALYESMTDMAGMADMHSGLSDVYYASGNYKDALSHFKNYTVLKDSIFNDKNKRQVLETEVGYEFDKKQALEEAEHQKEIALKEAEVDKQKIINNAALAGFTLLIISGGGAFVSYKRRRDARQKVNEAQQMLEKTEVEMKALRAQMNPHFIFNSLNSINDFISKNKAEIATNYTAKFAKLMRMVLENSEKKEVPLSEDLYALELYMQLEQLRTGNKFNYSIIVSDAIDKDNTIIPPLLLQPFVENSIWHGFASMQSGGNIEITISISDQHLFCVVQDNGSGRLAKAEQQSGKKSMGTGITHMRLSLIKKTENAEAYLTYVDLPKGLRVELTLPYKTDF